MRHTPLLPETALGVCVGAGGCHTHTWPRAPPAWRPLTGHTYCPLCARHRRTGVPVRYPTGSYETFPDALHSPGRAPEPCPNGSARSIPAQHPRHDPRAKPRLRPGFRAERRVPSPAEPGSCSLGAPTALTPSRTLPRRGQWLLVCGHSTRLEEKSPGANADIRLDPLKQDLQTFPP